jgi:hypothetical protein
MKNHAKDGEKQSAQEKHKIKSEKRRKLGRQNEGKSKR